MTRTHGMLLLAAAGLAAALWLALRDAGPTATLAGGAEAWRLSPLWTVRALGVLAPPSAEVVDRDMLPDGTVRLLITGAGSGALACALAPGADALQCGADVPVWPDSARLAKQSDVLALWGKPRDGDDAAQSFAADGAPIALIGDRHSGYAIARGKKDGRFHAVAVEGGARQDSVPLVEGARAPFVVSTAAGSWALYHHDGALGGIALGEAQAPLEAGALPAGATPQICRHGDTSAVWFRDGADPRRWPVALHTGGRWQLHGPAEAAPSPAPSAPAPPPPAVRAAPAAPEAAADFGVIGLLAGADDEAPSGWGLPPDMRAPDPRTRAMFGDAPRYARDVARRAGKLPAHTFSCHGGAARVIWREPDGAATRILALRCDGGGCALEQARLDIDVKSWWIAAALGDRIAVVWRGPAGVLRMRSAPLADLPRAGDVALMDAEQGGGPAARDLEAFASSDRVLFLFRSGAGVHGLLLDAGGGVRALSAAKE